MSRTFKLHQDPYGTGEKLFKRKKITINPGVTVLVGCNGAGKTTLLRSIETQLKENKIPVLKYDNLHDGGGRAVSFAAASGDIQFAATAAMSSEGENIVMNLGRVASSLRPFIRTGETPDRSDKLAKAFARAVWGDAADKEDEKIPKERWLFFDAVDSGLSIDNVVDVKEYLFKTILEDAGDCDVYILVTANAFEVARGEECFDVYEGKYRTFKTYEAYRKFILNSRTKKNTREACSAE